MDLEADVATRDATDQLPETLGEVDATPVNPARVKPRRFAWAIETLIVLAFYYTYETIRVLASHGNVKPRAYRNALRLVGWERTLHIFTEQSVQHVFLGARWLIKVLNIYYGSFHFVITAGLLVWVFLRRHDRYRHLRNLLGITTFLALIGYWAFPLAPPRLYVCNESVPVNGHIGQCFHDTLAEVGGLWSYNSPVAKAVANSYAAMPSLHFAWALWCGLIFLTFGRRPVVRALAVVYPLLTLFAIVVTANHYYLDAVGGAVIFVAALAILRLLDRHHSLAALRSAET